jgi:transposase
MPTSSDFHLDPGAGALPVRRRRPRRLTPNFKADVSGQLDFVGGCPELAVPQEHLARVVWRLVSLLDVNALEAKYSSLGRPGYPPLRVLAVWVYASVIGLHYATEVARALETDLAFLLLSGGQRFKETTLRTFRRENGEFLANAVEQSLGLAIERGLIDPTQFSVDSVRIRAEASTHSMRTLSRSKQRLKELADEDVSSMDAAEQAEHAAKVAKHEAAVQRCDAEGRTSHSVTNESAGLLKFPSGAALPGHRVTVAACGTGLRFIASVLVNAAPNDFGLLEESVRGLHEALITAGMPIRPDGDKLQVAADPGYLSETDLRFADENRDWVDILIHQPPAPKRGKATTGGEGLFDRSAFEFHDDDSVTCPAGKPMLGPFNQGEDRLIWKGQGCEDCPLRAKCTSGKQRSVTRNPALDRLHESMHERMARPGAKERYNQRIATVEPVFSYLQDTMQFRRVSSRLEKTVLAELSLKILAHNLMRLHLGGRVLVVVVEGLYDGTHVEFHRVWLPLWSSEVDPAVRVANDPREGDRGPPRPGNGYSWPLLPHPIKTRELFSLPL